MTSTATVGNEPRPYRRTLIVRAAPEHVWSGLVDPATLTRWLCDRIDLDLRPGGAFRPGGPSCATVEPADGQVLTVEPGRRLELGWPIDGHQTRLTFEIEPAAAGTQLKVTHIATGGWPPGLDVPALWGLQLTQLRYLLETTSPPELLRPDFASPSQPLIWLGISIGAIPARIYSLLTSPTEAARWVGGPVRLELREGGVIDFGWRDRGPTHVTSFKKNRLLVHGWKEKVSGAKTRVTWSIMPELKGSRLEFLHEGFADRVDSRAYRQLWTAALVLLKDLGENDRCVGLGWEGPAAQS